MKALAERYANALVDVALENKQADQVKQELAAFAAMVRESNDLHAFLANPSIAILGALRAGPVTYSSLSR